MSAQAPLLVKTHPQQLLPCQALCLPSPSSSAPPLLLLLVLDSLLSVLGLGKASWFCRIGLGPLLGHLSACTGAGRVLHNGRTFLGLGQHLLQSFWWGLAVLPAAHRLCMWCQEPAQWPQADGAGGPQSGTCLVRAGLLLPKDTLGDEAPA